MMLEEMSVLSFYGYAVFHNVQKHLKKKCIKMQENITIIFGTLLYTRNQASVAMYWDK
jgi:hypothetical protein